MRNPLVFSLVLVLAGCSSHEIGLQAKQENQQVLVAGETNLPDGAQLLLGLRKSATDDPICQALPLVKGGRYEGKLKLPQRFIPGHYELRVEFSPRAYAWSERVLPEVGKDGEKLAGPLVRDSGLGYRILERIEGIDLK